MAKDTITIEATELEVVHTPQEMMMMERQERALIDVQIATAKAYPRSVERAVDNALAIVQGDKKIAEECIYKLPRAGGIDGPSVRLAEILALQWQNLGVQMRIIDVNETQVVALANGIDLENNYRVSAEVRRRIVDKNGRRYNDDMITVTSNAATSIAFRNAVLKLIPKAYTNRVYEECLKIAVGNQEEIKTRRQRAVDYFVSLGVTKRVLLEHLGLKSVNEIGRADLEYLIGLTTAIKEGDTTVVEVFSQTRDGEPIQQKTAETKMDEFVETHSDTLPKPKEKAKEPKDTPPIKPAQQSSRDWMVGQVETAIEKKGITGEEYDALLSKQNITMNETRSMSDGELTKLLGALGKFERGKQ